MLMMSFVTYKADDYWDSSTSTGIWKTANCFAWHMADFHSFKFLYFFGGMGPVDRVQHSMEFAFVLDWEDVEKAM